MKLKRILDFFIKSDINEQDNLDIVLACSRNDIKYLPNLFISYELYFRINGKIYLIISKKSLNTVKTFKLPKNLEILIEENFSELSDDGYTNQMYLKLIAYRYVSSTWFWIIDSDFIFTNFIYFNTFFKKNKPLWFYSDWTSTSKKIFKKYSDKFLGINSTSNFLTDKPLFIFNKNLVEKLDKQYNFKNLLTYKGNLSEFHIYGQYCYHNFKSFYRWINTNNFNPQEYPGIYINQVYPDYFQLNYDVSFNEFSKCRFVGFWSHWDEAKHKIVDFLIQSQIKNYGFRILKPDTKTTYLPVDINDLIDHKLYFIDACYKDGWLKKDFAFVLKGTENLFISFDITNCLSNFAMEIHTNFKYKFFRLDQHSFRLEMFYSKNCKKKFLAKLGGGRFEKKDQRMLYGLVNNVVIKII